MIPGVLREHEVTYAEAMEAALAGVDHLDAAHLSRLGRLLHGVRDDVIRQLIAAGARDGDGTWDAFHLQNVSRWIDEAMQRFQWQYRAAQTEAVRSAWAAGEAAASWPIRMAGGPAPYGFGIDRRLMEIGVQYSAGLVRHVSEQTRKELDGILLRGLLGDRSSWAILQDVSALLDPEPWQGTDDPRAQRVGPGFNRNPLRQAETVMRTERARMFSLASRATTGRMAEFVPGLKKRWVHGGGGKQPRDYHRDVLHGQTIPWNERFDVNGWPAWGPHDPELPAGEAINCFPPGTRVSGHVLAALKSRYAGPLREIETRGGRRLAVTPNHPVLTAQGLIPANRLREGDHVLVAVEATGALRDVDHENSPPRVEDVFHALAPNGRCRVPVAAGLDFHGDAQRGDGYVDVVGLNGVLQPRLEPGDHQRVLDLTLVPPDAQPGPLDVAVRRDRAPRLFVVGHDAPPNRLVGRADLVGALARIHGVPDAARVVGTPANLGPRLDENARDGLSAYAAFLGQLVHANAGLVAFEEIVQVREFDFDGHVYDLSCEDGMIVAGGIYCSNCTCRAVPVMDEWAAWDTTAERDTIRAGLIDRFMADNGLSAPGLDPWAGGW